MALAWPETYCKTTSSWYDRVTKTTGHLTNGYYMAGHAAILLIEKDSGKCSYYDFGRYHAPFMNGRVRSAASDHELTVVSIAKISYSGKNVDNLDEILQELQANESCHGDGTLYASLSEIDFETANSKADQMQQASPIPYGPFIPKGTNCSRFVNSVLLAGKPKFTTSFKLRTLMPLTPSPMSNVRANGEKIIIPAVRPGVHPYSEYCPGKKFFKTTLPAPEQPSSLPSNSKWISGEGSGSWFTYEKPEAAGIFRYTPNGELESKMDSEIFHKYWGKIIAGR